MLTVTTRTRFVLVLIVFALGGGISLVVSEQRDAIVGSQAQTAAAGDLLAAMLDQETGVHDFDQTSSPEFLEPFRSGRARFVAVVASAERRAEGDDTMIEQLRAQSVAADRWHVLGEEAIRDVRLRGAKSLSIAGARERKSVMDAFRQENAAFREHVHARAEAQLVRMQLVGLVLVIAIGALVLGGGLWLLERASRRAARRRAIEREFVETLQTAEDEAEVQDLLKRHVERSCEGTAAVVLNRNASGNVLTACTDPARIPGVADALEGAGPRDCLAVRRGTPYQRSATDVPLQPCGICGDLPGASRCTPSLVGGEVIGSLLVTHHRTIGRQAEEVLTRAVTQSAPVLANLRNLAIAEHRAATDGLTGLPNARSVRETLARMAAQADRSAITLSAIAIDLDHFKSLNDRYGHQAGDDALAAVGAALRGGLRVSDFAGRWGGEEFVVLLPDTASAGAAQVAEKLRESVAAITIPAVPAGFTASLGVATLPGDAATGDELMRAADRALYAAKAGGRDRVAVAGEEPSVTAVSG